ncbi:MAG: hypothetical protein QXN59_02540 [Candidatus Micrarchaeaceae archaeon]
MELLVSAVKHTPSGDVYTLVGGKVLNAQLDISLAPLEKAEIKVRDGMLSHVSGLTISKAGMKELEQELGRICALLGLDRPSYNCSPEGEGRADIAKVDREMEGDLSAAAKEFAKRLISGAPIVVRFHNDGDGSSGGLALHRAIRNIEDRLGIQFGNLYWKAHKGIYYSEDDMTFDSAAFGAYDSAMKPMVVIIDFGTAPGSNAALKRAFGKVDFIWLDHHPVVGSFAKDMAGLYINPWDFGGDSNYTAGMLASRFAELLSGKSMRLLKEVSMISDMSKYADRSYKDANKIATVLDFVTGSKGSKNNGISPAEMNRLIDDGRRLSSLFSEISEIIEDSLSSGAKYSKKYKSSGGFYVRVLDFEKVLLENPKTLLPGRYSSRLHESLFDSNGKYGITIVSFGSYISIRVSKGIASKVALQSIIEKLSRQFGEGVSGGGHSEASSIKVPDKEMLGDVLKSLLRELGVRQ